MATVLATQSSECVSNRTGSETSSDSFEISRQTANQKKTKIVVREIPKFVTEDEIKSHLTEFTDKYNYFYFTAQPNIPNPTRRIKTNYSRFYINFTSFEDAIPFIEKFQKLSFQKKIAKPKSESKSEHKSQPRWTDKYNKAKTNRIYQLCVEFAPNQSIPKEIATKEITTKDRRMGTIEKDKDYLAFCAGLEKEQKRVEITAKKAEKELIRQNVLETRRHKIKDSDSESKDKTSVAKDTDKESIIAPLAKHVASQRHRRYSKKIDRASLVKNEKLKARNVERNREQRRRKRIAMAKAQKYQRKRWRDRGEGYEYRGRGRGRGRKHRGRGRGRGRERWDRDREERDERERFSGYSRRKGQQTWKAKPS